MPTIESPIDRRTRRDQSRTAAGFARAALLVAIVLVNLTALMVALFGGAPAAHAATLSLHIMVPKPTNNIASGPVGANVSVSGVGNPNSTYKIGYAAELTPLPPSPPSPTLDACSQGFKDLQVTPVRTQQDGIFSDTFVWPSSAGASGSNYYVCAQDEAIVAPPTGASIQSSEFFKVLASDAPSISLTVATTSNATPVPTPTDGGYYAGSRIEITGTNFLPGGTALRAYVTVNPSFSASDARSNYRPLLQDSGSATFSSDSSGSFDKIVTLPQTPLGIGVYLHVVSTDNTPIFPPALDANQQINLDRALPTPTPSPTTNPTVTTSPATTPGHNPGGPTPTPDHAANVLAVIGLSGLSIILFVVGIILMTSVSTMVERRR